MSVVERRVTSMHFNLTMMSKKFQHSKILVLIVLNYFHHIFVILYQITLKQTFFT